MPGTNSVILRCSAEGRASKDATTVLQGYIFGQALRPAATEAVGTSGSEQKIKSRASGARLLFDLMIGGLTMRSSVEAAKDRNRNYRGRRRDIRGRSPRGVIVAGGKAGNLPQPMLRERLQQFEGAVAQGDCDVTDIVALRAGIGPTSSVGPLSQIPRRVNLGFADALRRRLEPALRPAAATRRPPVCIAGLHDVVRAIDRRFIAPDGRPAYFFFLVVFFAVFFAAGFFAADFVFALVAFFAMLSS